MKLLRDRAFHVQAVDALPTDVQTPPQPPKPPVDFVRLTVVARNLVTHVAVTGGALYTSKKVVDAVTEIAVLAAKAHLK